MDKIVNIEEYDHLKKLSLRKLKIQNEYSIRRLNSKIIKTDDSNLIVLVNFIIKNDTLIVDYNHPIIGSVRQIAMFLKSPNPLTKDSPIELIKKADNARKDIRTIANKNKIWIELDKEPFNSLSDYEGQAWLVLYQDDYLKLMQKQRKEE